MQKFFASAADFRDWLQAHAATSTELRVGFHKTGSGQPSMTWPESVDEALCVGWIDGVRQRIDEHDYQIRFTPRKPGSTWSAINIAKVGELQKQGRMQPAGLAAFALRSEQKSRTYAYEQADTAAFAAVDEQQFRADARAWEFFQNQPAGYRQKLTWWVVNAKQESTRKRRLAQLIEACGLGRRL